MDQRPILLWLVDLRGFLLLLLLLHERVCRSSRVWWNILLLWRLCGNLCLAAARSHSE
jgi:hypothetical protein